MNFQKESIISLLKDMRWGNIMFEKLLKFFEPKWKEFLFTQDLGYYMKVKGKLLAAGITHKTKISNGAGAGSNRSLGIRTPSMYTILVEKDGGYEASRAISHDKID